LEITNAYCTVADNGMHHEPMLVTRIVDKDGKEVYSDKTQSVQVIPYKSAFFMQQLLQGSMREPGGTSQSLWGYIGQYRDTEFGGKTGTSNNNSDGWFMCVSPKLVVGAWVGGEYRSIHFRTGALGQGSRTALPITGYFMQSVLADPNFSRYHGKFQKPEDANITRDMYICDSYVTRAKPDTIAADSTNIVTEEEIILDENGNPVQKEKTPDVKEPSTATPPEKKPEKAKPTKEEVTFDNL